MNSGVKSTEPMQKWRMIENSEAENEDTKSHRREVFVNNLNVVEEENAQNMHELQTPR